MSDHEEIEEIETPGVAAEEAGNDGNVDIRLHSGMFNDPRLMAALAGQLQNLMGRSSGMVESLPPAAARRVRALKQLQAERVALRKKFHEELDLLEQKYHALNQPLYDKRKSIIDGSYKPKDDELYPSDAPAAEAEEDEEDNGLESFWMAALCTHPDIAQNIMEHDEEALSFLTDIKLEYLPGASTGYSLHFHFAENPFFTNEVLTKTYHLSAAEEDEADEKDGPSLMYDGPYFKSAEGTQINWKAGKCLTHKTVTQKQKKKRGADAGKIRTVKREIPQMSFFSFFAPPAPPPEDDEEAAEAYMDSMEEDYEFGEIIATKIIPDAVLWFTGEALEYEGMGEDEGEDDDDDEHDHHHDDDDDDDDDESHDPTYKPPAGGQPPECKQS